MPKLLCISVIRHGECLSSNTRGFQKLKRDHLTDHGEQQVRTLAEQWKNVRIDALYSSPAEPAHETAKALSSRNIHKPEIILDDLIIPRELGVRVFQLFRLHDPTMIHGEVYGRPSGPRGTTNRLHRPGGDGESYRDVAIRAMEFIGLAVKEHAVEVAGFSEPPPRLDEIATRSCLPEDVPEGIQHIVVVSHNNFLSELFEALQNWNTGDHQWSTYRLETGDWSRFVLVVEPYPEQEQKYVSARHKKLTIMHLWTGRLNCHVLKGWQPKLELLNSERS